MLLALSIQTDSGPAEMPWRRVRRQRPFFGYSVLAHVYNYTVFLPLVGREQLVLEEKR